MADLVPVTRPNGNVYRPRKAPSAVEIWNDDEGCVWVYVLRTHDIERAWNLACGWMGAERDTAEPAWVRHVMRDGDHWYERDEVRGAPCVIFEVNR